jgi:hypothetical protein
VDAIYGTPRAVVSAVIEDGCATNRPDQTGSGGRISAKNAGTTTSQVYLWRQARLARKAGTTPVPRRDLCAKSAVPGNTSRRLATYRPNGYVVNLALTRVPLSNAASGRDGINLH